MPQTVVEWQRVRGLNTAGRILARQSIREYTDQSKIFYLCF